MIPVVVLLFSVAGASSSGTHTLDTHVYAAHQWCNQLPDIVEDAFLRAFCFKCLVAGYNDLMRGTLRARAWMNLTASTEPTSLYDFEELFPLLIISCSTDIIVEEYHQIEGKICPVTSRTANLASISMITDSLER